MTLLSAGCSFIYGAELSDSLDASGLTPPSNKTWTSLYAKSRNYNHITVGTCGISNQGIVRKVIDAVESYKIDRIIVQWTYLNRFELLMNDNTFQTFSFWHSNDYLDNNFNMLFFKERNKNLCDIATVWFKHVYDDNTAYYYYLKSKLELMNYLKLKKIPYVFFDSEDIIKRKHNDSINLLETLLNKSCSLSFNGRGFYDWSVANNFPIGQHNHPLDAAHFAAFNLIAKDIDEKFQSFEYF